MTTASYTTTGDVTGLGTNAGLRRIAAGVPDISYDELKHVSRRYLDGPSLRAACARVANATLAVRNPLIWGEAGTACASDSTKFGAWDRNLMSEWHARYGGRGVMIYWHVERESTCVYSRLKRGSAMLAMPLSDISPWHNWHCGSVPVFGQPVP